MLALAIAALLSLPASPQDPTPAPAPAPPSAEEVQAVVAELEAAFKQDQPAVKIAALVKSRKVVDGRVIALVSKGLKDKEPGVASASIESLRWMAHPDALASLQGYCKAEKKRLSKDQELYPRVLKAIGQHGSPSSIPILLDDVQSQMHRVALRARILGLANIRSEKAVEAEFELMKRVGFIELYTYGEEFRLALMRLTGKDLGTSTEAWRKWWDQNKKGYKISPLPQELPAAEQATWNAYWEIPTPKEPPQEDPRGKRE